MLEQFLPTSLLHTEEKGPKQEAQSAAEARPQVMAITHVPESARGAQMFEQRDRWAGGEISVRSRDAANGAAVMKMLKINLEQIAKGKRPVRFAPAKQEAYVPQPRVMPDSKRQVIPGALPPEYYDENGLLDKANMDHNGNINKAS